MAMLVSSRLWLGGVVSPTRDRHLIDSLQVLVASCARPVQPLLVCVDGLAAYRKSICRAFRLKVERETKQRGRPKLAVWPELAIGVVIKGTVGRFHKLVKVERRIVRGEDTVVTRQIKLSGGGQQINTSYIEGFKATLRERLGRLTRKCRRAAHKTETLHTGMYLVVVCIIITFVPGIKSYGCG